MFLTLPKGCLTCTFKSFYQLQYQYSFFSSCFDSFSGLVWSYWRNFAITMTYMGMPIPMPEDGIFAYVLVVKMLDSAAFHAGRERRFSSISKHTFLAETWIFRVPREFVLTDLAHAPHSGHQFYSQHMPNILPSLDTEKGGAFRFYVTVILFTYPFLLQRGKVLDVENWYLA